MEDEKIRVELKFLISEIIEVPAEEFGDNDKYVEDLGVDSLLALEILAAVEKKYRIAIPETYLPRIRTFNETMEVVKESIDNKTQNLK